MNIGKRRGKRMALEAAGLSLSMYPLGAYHLKLILTKWRGVFRGEMITVDCTCVHCVIRSSPCNASNCNYKDRGLSLYIQKYIYSYI